MNSIFSNDPGHPHTVMLYDATANHYRVIESSDFDLSRRNDTVAADPFQYQSAPSNYLPGSSVGTLFSLALGEKGFIQNLGTSIIYVKKGGACSASSFSFILKAGLTADDGNGGFATINDWMGDVSVFSPNINNLRYIAWKMTV